MNIDKIKITKKLLSGFQISESAIKMEPFQKVVEVILLKDKYSLEEEGRQESDRVQQELSAKISEVINDFCDSYVKEFEENREEIQDGLIKKCNSSLQNDFDQLFKRKVEPIPSVEVELEEKQKQEQERLVIEEVGATILSSVASGITSLSDVLKKKVNKG